MSEYSGGDPLGWRYESGDDAGYINGIIEELNTFRDRRGLPFGMIDDMLLHIGQWRIKFQQAPHELRQKLEQALVKTELHIALLYLDAFNDMDDPPENVARRAYRLIKLLESKDNLAKAVPSSSLQHLQAMNDKMLQAGMNIDMLYPEIRDGIQAEEGDNEK